MAAYVPAVRTGNHVFTSGQLPMRDGRADGDRQGRRRGDRRRRPSSARSSARSTRSRRSRPRSATSSSVKRVVKVVALRRLHPRLHRPAAGRQRRLRAARRGLRRRGRARPVGRRRPGAAARRARSRSSSSSRSETPPTDARIPLPAAAGRARARVRRRRRGRRPSRATRRPSCCCGRHDRTVRRSTCCAARPRWRSPAGMCVFPGGGVDPRDSDHAVGLGRADAGGVGDAAGRRRGDGAGAGLRGRARDVRGVGRAAGRDSPTTVVADTTGDDWEADRVALEARELAFTEFLDRRGLVLRTDLLGVWAGWLTPVFEPRRYRTWFFVAAAARGPAHPRRLHRVATVTWLPAHAAVRRRRRRARCSMLPPTYLTCLEVGAVRRPGRRARRGRRARPSRCSRPRSRCRPTTSSSLSMPERLRATW